MNERRDNRTRILTAVTLVGIALGGVPLTARAQQGGDPYRTYTDQMVLDNINRRRMEERIRARSGKGKGVKDRKASAKVTKPAAPPLGTLECGQDLYSDFGREDPQGYTLQVTLMPAGKAATAPLVRWFRVNGPKGITTARFERVPPGQYRLTARAILPDKTQRAVLLGTQIGSPTDPKGGNFAPSTTVTFRAGKDSYGSPTVEGPTNLWFRPVE